MGGTLVRSIGLMRARIGLKNLAYNLRRLVQLERLAAAANVTVIGGEVCLESALRGKQTRREAGEH